MTVSITPLTSVFAGEVGPIDLRKVHDRETLERIPVNRSHIQHV